MMYQHDVANIWKINFKYCSADQWHFFFITFIKLVSFFFNFFGMLLIEIRFNLVAIFLTFFIRREPQSLLFGCTPNKLTNLDNNMQTSWLHFLLFRNHAFLQFFLLISQIYEVQLFLF